MIVDIGCARILNRHECRGAGQRHGMDNMSLTRREAPILRRDRMHH